VKNISTALFNTSSSLHSRTRIMPSFSVAIVFSIRLDRHIAGKADNRQRRKPADNLIQPTFMLSAQMGNNDICYGAMYETGAKKSFKAGIPPAERADCNCKKVLCHLFHVLTTTNNTHKCRQ
jgi:hypothetical protein